MGLHGRGEREEFMRPNDFFFAVRAKLKGDVPIVRILGFGAMNLELGYDPYTLLWVKVVESIEYVGEYPLRVGSPSRGRTARDQPVTGQ